MLINFLKIINFIIKKACRFGHLEVVKYLIEKNAKTEVLSNNGSSLLAIGKINNFLID
jgi:hypothetical protein